MKRWAGKVPVLTCTDNKKDASLKDMVDDRLAWLSGVKKIIDQALVELERERYIQKSERIENTVLDAISICAIERQQWTIRSTVRFSTWSVARDALGNKVVEGHTRKATMRAVVQTAMIKTISGTLS